jgi:hypothetical protein
MREIKEKEERTNEKENFSLPILLLQSTFYPGVGRLLYFILFFVFLIVGMRKNDHRLYSRSVLTSQPTTVHSFVAYIAPFSFFSFSFALVFSFNSLFLNS